MNKRLNSSPLSSPWTFFAATFAWTWFFWVLAAVLRLGNDTAAGGILLYLGVLGPMIAGIGLTYLTYGQEGRRDYWKRVIDFKRISLKWYLVILLFAPVLSILAALLDKLLGGSGATWGEASLNLFVTPLYIIPSLLFATLIPFIEELGWRGYVLDRLQAKWSALVSTLIVGSAWSLWHLPLFFVEGTYQANLGVGSLEFWLFMIGIIPLSFAFTWIYNDTRRSTLAVILFHGMINFTGELIAVTERADAFAIGLWVIAAIGIVAIWRGGFINTRPRVAHAKL
jgi:membrane protease YdiL (CAAX protease family)